MHGFGAGLACPDADHIRRSLDPIRTNGEGDSSWADPLCISVP